MDFVHLAERAARAGGAVLKAKFSGPLQVMKKGAIDLVTDADKAAEEAILAVLAETGHAIVAEESGSHGRSDYQWYVDPLDGTTNYAHRVPHFSVSVALYYKGEAQAACVLEPLRDDCFTAARGKGSFLNGARCQVTETAQLQDAMLATGFPYWIHERPAPVLTLFGEFAKSAQSLRRFGSAALDLAWIAAGRYDGFFEFGLKPWDIAAGILLVTEAGGRVSAMDGSPLSLQTGDILAGNEKLFEELLRTTRGVVGR